MSRRETDDDYDEVVARLGPNHRVIVCADDIQWIVQDKSGVHWRSQAFCTSRAGVLRRTKGLPGQEVLADLPERFRSPGKRRLNVPGAA